MRAAKRQRPSGKATWGNLMTGPGPRRATPAARMEKRSVARMPALSRERPKPHAPVCPGLKSSASGVTLIFRCPVSGTGRLRQLPWRQARHGSAAGRKSRQAGKRTAMWSRETAGAIRGFPEDRARQNNILWEVARRAPAPARNQSSKQRARGKPEPPKASRHSCMQRRRNPERSKDRDDGQDRRPRCRTRIRPGSNLCRPGRRRRRRARMRRGSFAAKAHKPRMRRSRRALPSTLSETSPSSKPVPAAFAVSFSEKVLVGVRGSLPRRRTSSLLCFANP